MPLRVELVTVSLPVAMAMPAPPADAVLPRSEEPVMVVRSLVETPPPEVAEFP